MAKRHAMQLGLGAAALTKFCRKKLRMKTTAIELNPQVVAACRLWFKLPADDARLSVVLGDAAEVAAHDALARHGRCAAGGPVRPRSRRAGAGQRSVLCAIAAAADRGRLHDGQPVRPLVQLRAQPAQRSGRLRRRLRSGRSGRRARATPSCWRCASRSTPSGPSLPSGRKPSKLAGACRPANGCGVFKPVPARTMHHERACQAPDRPPSTAPRAARLTGGSWSSG